MAVTQTQIDQADAQIRSLFPAYTKYIHADTFQVNGTIAASAAANASQSANIVVSTVSAASQQVPQSQVWLFTDIYTRTTTDTGTDATAQFVKNGVKTIITSSPLQVQLVTNQTRPGLPAPMIFEPNSKLTVNLFPIAAAGTNATTDTFFIVVTIYDSSFG